VIIVSQDKMEHVEYKNIICTYNCDEDIWWIQKFNGNYNDLQNLGFYSTKEKALKVMDMIKEKYLEYERIQGGQLYTIDGFIQPQIHVLPKAFEMPQDNEV